MRKLVIFDLDGTLVDAYPALIASVAYTVKRLGYPVPSATRIRRAVGRGQRFLFKPFIDGKDLGRALRIFKPHHHRALLRGVRWLPHARRVLNTLKRRGALLAIASNRPAPFTRQILRVLRAGHYFDAVRCADQVRRGKPHPQMLHDIRRRFGLSRADTVYVGDMPIDIDAGRRAGLTTIGVATGSSTLKELKAARPTVIIKDLPDLLTASV